MSLLGRLTDPFNFSGNNRNFRDAADALYLFHSPESGPKPNYTTSLGLARPNERSLAAGRADVTSRLQPWQQQFFQGVQRGNPAQAERIAGGTIDGPNRGAIMPSGGGGAGQNPAGLGLQNLIAALQQQQQTRRTPTQGY